MKKFWLAFISCLILSGTFSNVAFGQSIWRWFFKPSLLLNDNSNKSKKLVAEPKNSKELVEKTYFEWLSNKYAKENVVLKNLKFNWHDNVIGENPYLSIREMIIITAEGERVVIEGGVIFGRMAIYNPKALAPQPNLFLEPDRGNLIIKLRIGVELEEYFDKWQQAFDDKLYYRGGVDTSLPLVADDIKSPLVFGVPTGKLGEYVWVEFKDGEDQEAFKQLLGYVKEYDVANLQTKDQIRENNMELLRLRNEKLLGSNQDLDSKSRSIKRNAEQYIELYSGYQKQIDEVVAGYKSDPKKKDAIKDLLRTKEKMSQQMDSYKQQLRELKKYNLDLNR